jgi:ribosomal protein S13
MGNYIGGSAPAMARQVCDGYTLMSATNLKRLSLDQMTQLEFEIDKKLRETRSDQPDSQDLTAIQQRNRRLSRIEAQIRVLRHTMQQRRMGRL